MTKKKIVILGVTGSIGQSTLKVVRHLPDQFEVVGIAGGRRWQETAEIANEFKVPYASVANQSDYENFSKALADTQPLCGEEALIKMCTLPEVDLVLCGIVGTGALIPVYEAVKLGKTIALASKEILVAAGEIIMEEAHKSGAQILPVDSEHSAIFQCLEGKSPKDIRRVILTCSGGPFLRREEDFSSVKVENALKHPTWEMGRKISIDSASLMNKALEVIEARWLFDLEPNQVDVVVHPQSIVHSMVEFTDNTVLSQMSENDMVFPIQFAMTYPDRYSSSLKPMDFTKAMTLTFEEPDHKRFPSLRFAHDAMAMGGAAPAILNAVNEVAVLAFLDERIRFSAIWDLIRIFLEKAGEYPATNLDEILATDARVRRETEDLILSGVYK
ncbi:1-deoxy-D-xylulose-5-phosphate reductoisomerase [Lentisphaera profundi]|uniref:1-deoxy-D-xylulose 5-phosphate reductoisomerase n=1 Tax=Lentisphaera profundi TaxID=1658616 RepID=A0ABY7VYX3_9BACT|nr:1-deoxy-D-xylulose-5-phosphate reductoisomerase [Lentisphaera profundi]WDE99106.1 1-deoxy-D-xylulose-5-phosphate reductoisomerase [Lentisphaera profundi]